MIVFKIHTTPIKPNFFHFHTNTHYINMEIDMEELEITLMDEAMGVEW